MTEKELFKVKAAEMGFCEKFTVWHFATKCAAVKFVKPWMSSSFSVSRMTATLVRPGVQMSQERLSRQLLLAAPTRKRP